MVLFFFILFLDIYSYTICCLCLHLKRISFSLHNYQLTCILIYVFQLIKVFIKHKVSRKLIAKGRKRRNVYMLDILRWKVFFSNRQVVADSDTWHSRLGDSSISLVKLQQAQDLIKLNDKSASPSVCVACQLGKSKYLPFELSIHKSTKPFWFDPLWSMETSSFCVLGSL